MLSARAPEVGMVTYEDALRGLTQRGPGRMIPDLQRITALAELLGDPQSSYPVIHITGTNGKTSVARMVTALLGALGVQAGTYSSPHIQDVRERLRVSGRPISRRAFSEAFTAVAGAADLVDAGAENAEDRVTYFEFLTAMAFWWFADHPVDIGVFEVGMGGRWDATNLVRGEVAVIGPVDVDHRELGGTPEEVASEKVGIVEDGATVISAAQHPEVDALIRRTVRERSASLLVVPDDVAVVDRSVAVGGQLVAIRTPSREHHDLFLPLHGRYQTENAALALGAVHALLGGLDAVDDDVLREGFRAVAAPGRLEVVQQDPTVVLDGAHNPHGAARTVAAVAESFTFRDLILVLGCLRDKDVRGILQAFRDAASHVVVTRAPSARAVPAEELARIAEEVWVGTGVAVEVAPDVGAALVKATGVAGPEDGVLVTGSLFTVGAARDVYLPFEDADGDEEEDPAGDADPHLDRDHDRPHGEPDESSGGLDR
jgi:dihydrofolate synthase / folylpolyglutamate synthase